jgi:hypothetical protein
VNRATIEDVDRLLLDADDGLTTDQIIEGLRAAGFDADRAWFWTEIAPQIIDGADVEYVGDKVTGVVH